MSEEFGKGQQAPTPEIDPEEACRDLLNIWSGQVGLAMNFAVIEAYKRGARGAENRGRARESKD